MLNIEETATYKIDEYDKKANVTHGVRYFSSGLTTGEQLATQMKEAMDSQKSALIRVALLVALLHLLVSGEAFNFSAFGFRFENLAPLTDIIILGLAYCIFDLGRAIYRISTLNAIIRRFISINHAPEDWSTAYALYGHSDKNFENMKSALAEFNVDTIVDKLYRVAAFAITASIFVGSISLILYITYQFLFFEIGMLRKSISVSFLLISIVFLFITVGSRKRETYVCQIVLDYLRSKKVELDHEEFETLHSLVERSVRLFSR